MPYGGSKFRLRFFGTIMLTPCKANLAGYFCMFTALTTLPRVFIPSVMLARAFSPQSMLTLRLGHRSGVTYALAHLAAARTAGVRCAMKCRARPSGRGATIAAQNYLQICPATGRVARGAAIAAQNYLQICPATGRVARGAAIIQCAHAYIYKCAYGY